MQKSIVFFDTETGIDDKKIHDIGAVRQDGAVFHSASKEDFCRFIKGAGFVCGHNIIHHDLKVLGEILEKDQGMIDTLYLSPLLFPKRPYHALVKDEKLQVSELNNPVNDSLKARELFHDEVNAFFELPSKRKQIFCCLLYGFAEFRGFFDYVGFRPYNSSIQGLIASEFEGLVCSNADLAPLIKHYPCELAYVLALISANDDYSITPPWLLKNFPKIENIIKYLRSTPCRSGCPYCRNNLSIHKSLKKIFGFDSFRTYNGEPLQEKAAQAAVEGKSLLAVFPTGGGKSLTFQLPALMAGKNSHSLTVVISPLQSLMKDQVDHLSNLGITSAVTINGILDPIERADSYERVANGSASILYISPELLRSRSIEKMLLSRNIDRFVIDEAHCFSAWGQDFRVDYLYIGDFIRELQKKKTDKRPIPVSCFTATAKQKVISDIRDYFKRKLDLDLELFASSASRENLRYSVLFRETEEEKYNTLRNLIARRGCPTIVYVSRTGRSEKLAEKLTSDGFPALPFNGKMESTEKVQNQEAFIKNDVKVIVATSAFGMGVDKKDVGLVIHYDISDSLENYVQEAGRAGRDPGLNAECYVLFNNDDLDKHFILLNQTKLSISEIQQVWKAIKDLTRIRPSVCCSPLEIARQAGWDDSVSDVETRVKTAVAALETAGFVKRGQNVPHVYATSIMVKNMQEASFRIDRSRLLSTDRQKTDAKRIIKALVSTRSRAEAGNDDAESRVDYLADTLGLDKQDVIDAVNMMRQEKILADMLDMSAYIFSSDSENRSRQLLERFAKLERFLIDHFTEEGCDHSLKEINDAALKEGLHFSTVKNLRTLLYFLTIKNYIRKDQDESTGYVTVVPSMELAKIISKHETRIELCRFILETLYRRASDIPNVSDEKRVEFSLVGLFNEYNDTPRMEISPDKTTVSDMEDALLYLSKIGALKIEGGFLVIYNGMEIRRLVTDNKARFKADDYRLLDEYYRMKIRQIHIVGEYANLMVSDYEKALEFVKDYFQMDFRKFISRYFKGDRAREIEKNITPEKYGRLFDSLSEIQTQIINDSLSKYIVVAAGPGSGKTRVLVHKLASLLLMEDVKHEQMLMLTFSRAAATEFKKRLYDLIGNAARFVEIKTFHSYCFDLLGKIGSLEGVEDVVKNASEMIENGEVEPGRIAKRVLVIDEAQDMDGNEYRLVRALMRQNEDMRVIAVGDDDQNIFEFRGSDSKYMRDFIEEMHAVKYEMTENYRSGSAIVALANSFAKRIKGRLKHEQIVSVVDDPGTVEITQYDCPNMMIPLAEQIVRERDKGSTAVLTNTNDEALQITGLLLKNGVRARLIQSMDSMKLTNLMEIRRILNVIDSGLQTPVIPDGLWEKAKKTLIKEYSTSACLEHCLRLMEDFEISNSIKYRSDLDEFIKESNYEDFYADEKGTVFVSTIHKAKGREFDSVYLLLNNCHPYSDEEKRRIYVGLTRAKTLLRIYCNTDLFAGCDVPEIIRKYDERLYAEPDELMLQMSYRDVVLDFFKSRKALTSSLRSGDELQIDGPYLTAERDGKPVRAAKMSKAFSDTLDSLSGKGFRPSGAKVRFVVSWKGEEETEETPIILTDLKMVKSL
jgi:ATP-dependent DNA helicase RecQ